MKTIDVHMATHDKLATALYGTYGPLAVTREVTRTRHGGHFVITHLPTGYAVCMFRRLSQARDAAKAWRAFNWDVGAKDTAKIAILLTAMKGTPQFETRVH